MPKLPDFTELDLDSLYQVAIEQPKMIKEAGSDRIKFSESKGRFTKVAFDLYKDNQSEFIWRLEKDSETGEEFIIRTASKNPHYKIANNWTTAVDSAKNSITLVYKGHSIKLFKKTELSFDETSIEDWRAFLVDKIATDPTFLNKVLASVSEERKHYLVQKFPELTK